MDFTRVPCIERLGDRHVVVEFDAGVGLAANAPCKAEPFLAAVSGVHVARPGLERFGGIVPVAKDDGLADIGLDAVDPAQVELRADVVQQDARDAFRSDRRDNHSHEPAE